MKTSEEIKKLGSVRNCRKQVLNEYLVYKIENSFLMPAALETKLYKFLYPHDFVDKTFPKDNRARTESLSKDHKFMKHFGRFLLAKIS